LPRPEGAPPDRVRFQYPDGRIIHEAGWVGPWPPPERFGLAIGRSTGYVTVFEPEEVVGENLEAVRGVADVTYFRRTAASEITDDDPEPFLMRGASYEPEEEAST
jgi:hypothetical protein